MRDALLNPDARIAPGYGMVSARLRNGQTLQGFARIQQFVESNGKFSVH